MAAKSEVPTTPYDPALAWATALGATWVFLLVTLGAFTTSIGAGMVFPDWPLSNGSLNPEGWLTDLAKFAEHSHRLSAALMAAITTAIAVAVQRREPRRWVRRLAWGGVGLVFFQALLGGLRVLFDHLHIETVNTSVGRLFAMGHATLAQVYVCILAALVLALSRPWVEGRTGGASDAVRRFGRVCCALLLVQLAVAAVMRHSFAGLAIPVFPYSTPEGGWLPADWDFRVGIHFTHRVLAAVLGVSLVGFAVALWRDRSAAPIARQVGLLLAALVALQISLGAAVIWTFRNAHLTTAHVVVGALTLAATFGLTWWLHRDRIEGRARS